MLHGLHPKQRIRSDPHPMYGHDAKSQVMLNLPEGRISLKLATYQPLGAEAGEAVTVWLPMLPCPSLLGANSTEVGG